MLISPFAISSSVTGTVTSTYSPTLAADKTPSPQENLSVSLTSENVTEPLTIFLIHSLSGMVISAGKLSSLFTRSLKVMNSSRPSYFSSVKLTGVSRVLETDMS